MSQSSQTQWAGADFKATENKAKEWEMLQETHRFFSSLAGPKGRWKEEEVVNRMTLNVVKSLLVLDPIVVVLTRG